MCKFAWNAGIVGLFIFLLFAGAVADGKDNKAVTGFGFGGSVGWRIRARSGGGQRIPGRLMGVHLWGIC